MPTDLARLASRKDIDRRAGRIADPVERLRFLRRATAERPGAARRWVVCAVLAAALLPLRSDSRRPVSAPASLPVLRHAADAVPHVFPVEHTPESDLYSNGVRIENGLEVSGEPRFYTPIAKDSNAPGPRRGRPAGIVYHSTESEVAPFASEHRQALKPIGREVLLYVRQRRAYHFVIDRFGRVHRIVAEADAAYHAGNSVWADSRWIYVNLNSSFLGVALETRTADNEETVTDAQDRAARGLTELLRSRHNLPAETA